VWDPKAVYSNLGADSPGKSAMIPWFSADSLTCAFEAVMCFGTLLGALLGTLVLGRA
jgi:hypothetical protein